MKSIAEHIFELAQQIAHRTQGFQERRGPDRDAGNGVTDEFLAALDLRGRQTIFYSMPAARAGCSRRQVFLRLFHSVRKHGGRNCVVAPQYRHRVREGHFQSHSCQQIRQGSEETRFDWKGRFSETPKRNWSKRHQTVGFRKLRHRNSGEGVEMKSALKAEDL